MFQGQPATALYPAASVRCGVLLGQELSSFAFGFPLLPLDFYYTQNLCLEEGSR